jgi:mannose-6-phosphate isomerase-like protein (cupin superfamily)
MGLSSALNYEVRRRRLVERVRLGFFSWLYDNEEETLASKFRKPVNVMDLEGTLLSGTENSNGVRTELLTPDWALTSNLNVTVLTLPSGTELMAKKARGLEFYYVIKGEGVYSLSEKETITMTSGTAFIVDPGW